ncbi:hypothetical protein A2U01_0060030, partial [Trifolium medium]|nr:hypothetical protein [Trifolium medium]
IDVVGSSTSSPTVRDATPCPHDLDLEVVLPFHQATVSQSGVELLLREESLQDVDGYIAARVSSIAKNLEAEKLLTIQKELGMKFDSREAVPIGRMVNLEVRDRDEFEKRQESFRSQ